MYIHYYLCEAFYGYDRPVKFRLATRCYLGLINCVLLIALWLSSVSNVERSRT